MLFDDPGETDHTGGVERWVAVGLVACAACSGVLELDSFEPAPPLVVGSTTTGGSGGMGGQPPVASSGGTAATGGAGGAPGCATWAPWSSTDVLADASINTDNCDGADYDGWKPELAIRGYPPHAVVLLRFIVPSAWARRAPEERQARLVLPRATDVCAGPSCTPGDLEVRVLRNDWTEGTDPATPNSILGADWCRRESGGQSWQESGAAGEDDTGTNLVGAGAFDDAASTIVVDLDPAFLDDPFVGAQVSFRLTTPTEDAYLPLAAREAEDSAGARLEYRSCLD